MFHRTLRVFTTIFASALVGILPSIALGQETNILLNGFIVTNEGWLSSVNSCAGCTPVDSPADWGPTAGFIGGGIFHHDESGGHNYRAPSAYHGDFSMLVGRGRVTFDWKADHIDPNGRKIFAKFFNGNKFIIRTQPITTSDENVWLHLDFFFDQAAQWRFVDPDNNIDNPAATLSEICSVMSNVTDFLIAGESIVGTSETTQVDSVRLDATLCGCDANTPPMIAPWDFNNDLVVDGADLATLLVNWGPVPDMP